MSLTQVKVNKPGSPLHGKIGVIRGESSFVYDSSKEKRFLVRFANSPFTFGVNEEHLQQL